MKQQRLRPVHDEVAALVFETAAPGVAVGVEELAVAWTSVLPESVRASDDERKAALFASAVVAGLRSGFFRAD